MSNRLSVSRYSVELPCARLRIAVVADLHNSPYSEIIKKLKEISPDIIVSPGDLFGSLADCDTPGGHLTERYIAESQRNGEGFAFLKEASKIAPVYCSVGNHEVSVSEKNRHKIASCGAILLENSYVRLGDGIVLGGLSSGGAHGLFGRTEAPALDWLSAFSRLGGVKILLCHHPEYWSEYIAPLGIELTISGHAHGGQWRFFGRGLLAPGQGFFPRYSGGIYSERGCSLVVSRGLMPGGRIPRINNQPELVVIETGKIKNNCP